MKKQFQAVVIGCKEKPLLAKAAMLTRVGKQANNLERLLEVKMLLSHNMDDFASAYLAYLVEFKRPPEIGELIARPYVKAAVIKALGIYRTKDFRREFETIFMPTDFHEAGIGGHNGLTTPAPDGHYGVMLSDKARKERAELERGSGKRHTAGVIFKGGHGSRRETAYHMDRFWHRDVSK